jgi:hypothetical protein
VTAAQLEQALRALEQRLAAVEQWIADENAERDAVTEARRKQQLRDEVAARRERHWLELADVAQTLRWEREVNRAVSGYRRGRA